MAPELLVRRLEGRLERLVEEEPVIALHGPRSVGKSTLLRSVARTIGAQYVDLDDPGTRQAVASDPSLFASGGAPVCIDEYQHVPELLDAIKAELNRDLRPGRFLLAGSTRFDSCRHRRRPSPAACTAPRCCPCLRSRSTGRPRTSRGRCSPVRPAW